MDAGEHALWFGLTPPFPQLKSVSAEPQWLRMVAKVMHCIHSGMGSSTGGGSEGPSAWFPGPWATCCRIVFEHQLCLLLGDFCCHLVSLGAQCSPSMKWESSANSIDLNTVGKKRGDCR